MGAQSSWCGERGALQAEMEVWCNCTEQSVLQPLGNRTSTATGRPQQREVDMMYVILNVSRLFGAGSQISKGHILVLIRIRISFTS